jgi:hypothetical protein
LILHRLDQDKALLLMANLGDLVSLKSLAEFEDFGLVLLQRDGDEVPGERERS